MHLLKFVKNFTQHIRKCLRLLLRYLEKASVASLDTRVDTHYHVARARYPYYIRDVPSLRDSSHTILVPTKPVVEHTQTCSGYEGRGRTLTLYH